MGRLGLVLNHQPRPNLPPPVPAMAWPFCARRLGPLAFWPHASLAPPQILTQSRGFAGFPLSPLADFARADALASTFAAGFVPAFAPEVVFSAHITSQPLRVTQRINKTLK